MIKKFFDKLCEFGHSIQEKIFGSYETCYTEQEHQGNGTMGLCGGLVGGTYATGYLSEKCIGCPHLRLPNDKK